MDSSYRSRSAYYPKDNNIFSSEPPGPTATAKPPKAVTTVFPGSNVDNAKFTPRGTHGRHICQSSIELGSGMGTVKTERVALPREPKKHQVRVNDVAAGVRQEGAIVDQRATSGIFGNPGGVLREVNKPRVPVTAGMTGKERRDALTAWRNGKATSSA